MKSIHLVSRARLLTVIGLVVLLGFVTLLGSYHARNEDVPVDDVVGEQEEEAEVVFREEVEPRAPEDEGLHTLRLQRDRARSQEVDILRAIVDNPGAGEEARARAGERLLEISERLAMESQAEQLIISAGFTDALVYVMQDNALVLVKEDTLQDRAVSQIASMVSRVTGLSWEDINVREGS